jgi:BON domain
MGTTKEVRGAVEAELQFDPLVEDADIHVVNNNGNVALNGTVPSYPQYLEAAAASQRVAGVRNMHNHLQVVLRGEDYRDDATLTTAANNAPGAIAYLRLRLRPDADGTRNGKRKPAATRPGGQHFAH